MTSVAVDGLVGVGRGVCVDAKATIVTRRAFANFPCRFGTPPDRTLIGAVIPLLRMNPRTILARRSDNQVLLRSEPEFWTYPVTT